jgi:hypothetical protein
VTTDTDSAASISKSINSLVFKVSGDRKLEVTLPKDTLQKLVGNFLLEKDTLTVSFCGDALCLQQNFQPAIGYQMFFSDNNNFSVREVPNAFFSVIRNAEGKVEAFQLKQGDYNMRIPRIK